MTLPRKQVAAAVVLVAGVAVAWFFRRGSAELSETAAPTDRLVIRQSIAELASSTADFARRGDAKDSPAAHLLPPQVAPGANAPPELASTYDEAAKAAARAPQVMQWPPPVSTDRQPPFSSSPFSNAPFSNASASEKMASETSATAAPRTHRIVDGDTLARLAERYLGDSGRQAEIFDANRDRLKDPELLPIGAELRIPDDGSRLPLKPVPSGAIAPGGDKSAAREQKTER